MENIKILGAGLSGLTAAINLAKKGYEVSVYEKNKDVGMRFHSDLQGLENWSEKKNILEELEEMNIEINFDCDPFFKTIFSNGLRDKEISSKKPLFYLVKRGSSSGTFDYGLKEQALKLGVNIYFEKTLSLDEVDIVATGSIFKEVPVVAKGIVFKADFRDIVVMACNNELAFEGYSYLLVTKGYGCMCTVVFGKLDKVTECFERTKKFFVEKFNLDIQSPRNVSGVGSFSLKNTFKKGNVLYVGEAAGLQDFLWGFGMRYAVASGYLAAQSIINNEDCEKRAKEYFRNKLKASVVNRYLWEKAISRKNYSFMVDHAELVKKELYSINNYNLLRRIIYPIALPCLKKKYPKLKL